MTKANKSSFINEEIWVLTFGGAFQRSNIYKSNKYDDPQRKKFRNDIKSYIETNILPQYKNTVDEESHIQHLLSFSEWSKKYSHILNDGYLNIGVVQKILNLYLKYQWCLGNIEEPPHCPFDRIILQELNYNPIPSWTKLNSEIEYRNIAAKAKKIASKNNMSIAEWELDVFQRR